MNKIKFLLVNEASYAKSGFGNYGRNLLTELKKDPRLEIAELAFNATVNNREDTVSPWRFYANRVDPKDKRFATYNSKRENRYGEWRFEEILNDFKPNVVASICDPWMYTFFAKSPYRKYFKLLLMPTIDSLPYKPLWMDHLKLADSILTYSDWARRSLLELNENINLSGAAYCGVDTNVFKPLGSKKECKAKLGVPTDSIIIGNVARNQPRKLFGDLFQTFKFYLNASGRRNVYLFCFTKIPDGGWDIPFLIKHYGIEDRVLLCYRCPTCHKLEVSCYKGEEKRCKFCKDNSNLFMGIPETQLAELYNVMDVYVQYASAAGFEIPIIEAAACGIQTLAVDVAAMQDFHNNIGTIRLHPFKMQIDNHLCAERAVTHNYDHSYDLDHFIRDKLDIEPDSLIIEKVKQHYQWDKVASTWANAIVNCNPDLNAWKKPQIKINPEKFLVNDGTSMFEIFCNLKHGVMLNDNCLILELIKDKKLKLINNNIKNATELLNTCEELRVGKVKIDKEDYIDYARVKAEIYK